MKRQNPGVAKVVPTFVDRVPQQLEEGYLYVSLRYRTVTHLCACGCGVEVNTPLHPTGWAITYDGVTASLWPSVGNWGEQCGSHYLIEKNIVRWSRPWSRAEILDGRARRRREIRDYYGDNTVTEVVPDSRLHKALAWLRRRWSAWRRR